MGIDIGPMIDPVGALRRMSHTGRTATYVIAASDATALEKAQADYVCDGLGASSIANGTGTLAVSPTKLSSYNHKLNVATAGDFTLTLAAGVTATIYRMELIAGTYNIPINTVGSLYFYIKSGGTVVITQNGSGPTVTSSPITIVGQNSSAQSIGGTAGTIQIDASGTPSDGSGVIGYVLCRTATFYPTWTVGITTIAIPCAGFMTIKCDGGTDDVMIETALATMPNGGELHFSLGHFLLGDEVDIPAALNFKFTGEGIPELSFSSSGYKEHTYHTPVDGTQIMSPPAWNGLTTTSKSMFKRAAHAFKNKHGNLEISDMALMPFMGYSNTNTSAIYGITDVYSSDYNFDRVMFFPAGWPELKYSSVPDTTLHEDIYLFCNIANTGGGCNVTWGNIYLFAQGGFGTTFATVGLNDQFIVRLIEMYYCLYGIKSQNIWNEQINNMAVYGIKNWAWYSSYGTPVFHRIGRICYESLGTSPALAYIILIAPATGITRLTVDEFYNFPITGYSKLITSITNNDPLFLMGTTRTHNMSDNSITQTAPINKAFATPFGATIANPFVSTSVGLVAAGATKPTSATTYVANCPVDVTISGGTISEILIKDAQGNTILTDTSCANVLLLPNYTIKVTGTDIAAATVTVVQATIGRNYYILSSTYGAVTATPIANVNYVATTDAYFVSIAGGTDVSISTWDGSSNVKGNAMDAALTTITRYKLQPGQIINLGNFSDVPTTISVMRD
jgi:hypothetical protein